MIDWTIGMAWDAKRYIWVKGVEHDKMWALPKWKRPKKTVWVRRGHWREVMPGRGVMSGRQLHYMQADFSTRGIEDEDKRHSQMFWHIQKAMNPRAYSGPALP